MHNKLSTLSKEDFESGVVLLINKEINWTSFDVVKKIKNLLKEKFRFQKNKSRSCWHIRSPCNWSTCNMYRKVNKNDFRNSKSEKKNTQEIDNGSITTPSYDLETEIDHRYDISNISEKDIFSKTKLFIGEVSQKPPIFSAIKVKGERLYEKEEEEKK